MPAFTRSSAPLEATWKRETTFASWEAWDRQFQAAKAALPRTESLERQAKESFAFRSCEELSESEATK